MKHWKIYQIRNSMLMIVVNTQKKKRNAFGKHVITSSSVERKAS